MIPLINPSITGVGAGTKGFYSGLMNLERRHSDSALHFPYRESPGQFGNHLIKKLILRWGEGWSENRATTKQVPPRVDRGVDTGAHCANSLAVICLYVFVIKCLVEWTQSKLMISLFPLQCSVFLRFSLITEVASTRAISFFLLMKTKILISRKQVNPRYVNFDVFKKPTVKC